jgi:hypothetical protein
MLHKEFNNGLRAYPIHQAVQTMGSTATDSVAAIQIIRYNCIFAIFV